MPHLLTHVCPSDHKMVVDTKLLVIIIAQVQQFAECELE